MFAQLFLGIAMIIIGVCHLLNKRLFLHKNIESFVSDVRSFQKGAALSYFLLGILFMVMGIVEKKAIFETSTFIMVYIILAIIPLTIALVNNKKHGGKYWFW
ncbi:hypothetical protein BKP35_18060 [Anaerobacillus arseniciselenatis]|uniref:DUF3784 domain-containing protein n=1 Tax=Anaerobacillus arseniciselenatis TaxID=85682 RepID=A0A1S2L745_9BACI|nr:hypothetical protein [Anaerobacillus arseniciselenatis]OIJ08166.1 hypothetical protein BKP35_18060 [Anaerobacillus arseniciselenatis]